MKKKPIMISLQLTKKQMDWLKKNNKNTGETMSSIVRRLIEAAMCQATPRD